MTDDELGTFVNQWNRSRPILKQLNSIAEKEGRRMLNQVENPKAFEVANWQHYVAWSLGYRAMAGKMQELTRT